MQTLLDDYFEYFSLHRNFRVMKLTKILYDYKLNLIRL